MAADRRMVRAVLASTYRVLGMVPDSCIFGEVYTMGDRRYIKCGTGWTGGEHVALVRPYHEDHERAFPFPVQMTSIQIEPI